MTSREAGVDLAQSRGASPGFADSEVLQREGRGAARYAPRCRRRRRARRRWTSRSSPFAWGAIGPTLATLMEPIWSRRLAVLIVRAAIVVLARDVDPAEPEGAVPPTIRLTRPAAPGRAGGRGAGGVAGAVAQVGDEPP